MISTLDLCIDVWLVSFSLGTLKISLHCPLVSVAVSEKSAVGLTEAFCQNPFFPPLLAAFRIFHLSLYQCTLTLVCLDKHFYLSCWRFFCGSESLGCCVLLVLFETCLHSVLDIVFLALQFGCDQIQASLCSPHLGFFPLLAHLLTAQSHILDNFTALTFQLTSLDCLIC